MKLALLTDFGTRDPYVAAMKGVIASRTDAAIHDLTHDIGPFDVFEAAWFLRTVLPYWRDAVFVCVVDPGVGTSRRILAMRHETNVLLAPDNGLLTFVASDADASVALAAGRPSPVGKRERPASGQRDRFSVEKESLFLPNGSTTFHGRDRFAPVAAAIANGLPLEELGPPVGSIVRLPYEGPTYAADIVRGTIVAVDRYGNLITDIERAKIPFEDFQAKTTYSGDGPFLIVGSTGCVEISMAGASAAAHLHLKRLDRVELWPKNDES